ncbi:MAG: peptidylprolyl isomerase [Hyphomonas sp.]|jgi:peptidyl-prolyl cis-trans isomerase C
MHAKPLIFRAHLAALSMLAVMLAGCGETVLRPSDRAEVDQTVAAWVNGEAVLADDVELEAVARGLVSPGSDFGPGDDAYTLVLDQLIDQKLMAQEAEKLGLDRDPGGRRRLEMARERILGNLLVERLVADKVTEDAIDRMYSEQVRLLQANDRVRVAHILVETEAAAAALYRQIEQGASFESLVFNNSLDTRTRMENGDMGWLSPNEQPEPFPVVIANTPVGEVSPPFQTSQGWHLLKVKDRRTDPPQTREEMRPEIATFLTLNEVSRIIRRLRTEATIEQGTGQRYVPSTNPVPEAGKTGDDL